VADQPAGHGSERDCPFCNYRGPNPMLRWELASYLIEPLNPVTEGHLLVVSRRHLEDFTENPEHFGAVCMDAARIAQRQGGDYNLITSKGDAATQTVRHLHVHLLPRRPNDGLALPWADSLDQRLAAAKARIQELEAELKGKQ
jgi:histidine triad (HIT) family protein